MYSAPIQKFAFELLTTHLEIYGWQSLGVNTKEILDLFQAKCFSKYWIIEHASLMAMMALAECLQIDFIPYAPAVFDVYLIHSATFAASRLQR